MAGHDPDLEVPNPADDPLDNENLEQPPPDEPRARRRAQRARRARELEQQAAAARAAAEEACRAAEANDSHNDGEEVEDDEAFEDPQADDDVPAIPGGAIKLPTFDGRTGFEKYAMSFLEEIESYCGFYSVSPKRRIALLYTCFPLMTPARSWFQASKRRC